LNSLEQELEEDFQEVTIRLSRNQAQIHQTLREVQKVQKEYSTWRKARASKNTSAQCYRPSLDGRQQRCCVQWQIFQQR